MKLNQIRFHICRFNICVIMLTAVKNNYCCALSFITGRRQWIHCLGTLTLYYSSSFPSSSSSSSSSVLHNCDNENTKVSWSYFANNANEQTADRRITSENRSFAAEDHPVHRSLPLVCSIIGLPGELLTAIIWGLPPWHPQMDKQQQQENTKVTVNVEGPFFTL